MPISEKVLRLAEAYASLSAAERSEFARLVTADDDGNDPEGLGAEWTRTIRHRAAEIDAGEVSLVDGEDFLRRLRAV